jgi:S-adenosylmethionine synthetase
MLPYGKKFCLRVNECIPNPESESIEILETKGRGHPDTLADDLAEESSNYYSNYTKNKFGAILHHNFDKVGLLGGSSFVEFGKGHLTSPIKVLINGRVSVSFGKEKIPFRQLIKKVVKDFFKKRLPLINPEEDFEKC